MAYVQRSRGAPLSFGLWRDVLEDVEIGVQVTSFSLQLCNIPDILELCFVSP